jgi:hypothetical protein
MCPGTPNQWATLNWHPQRIFNNIRWSTQRKPQFEMPGKIGAINHGGGPSIHYHSTPGLVQTAVFSFSGGGTVVKPETGHGRQSGRGDDDHEKDAEATVIAETHQTRQDAGTDDTPNVSAGRVDAAGNPGVLRFDCLDGRGLHAGG